jgi:hypothetical protein
LPVEGRVRAALGDADEVVCLDPISTAADLAAASGACEHLGAER